MKAKKLLALTLATLMLCATLAACGDKPATDDASTTTDKITIGALEQNSIEVEAHTHMAKPQGMPEAWEFKEFSSINAMLMELQAGRLDSLVTCSSVANYLVAKDDKLLTFATPRTEHLHMAARAEDTELTEELNAAIDALKADGTIDKLIADYITNANGDPAVNAPVNNPGGETHVVAITGDLPPLDFVAADGTPAGFNVALLNAIAKKNGCNFEIVQMDATARLSALESGKIDLIFWIDCQGDADFEPETEGVSFTTPYFEGARTFVANSTDTIEKLKATMSTPK